MVQALRDAVIDIVLQRFPKLASLAEKMVGNIHHTTVLRQLVVRLSLAQTAMEAKERLLEADDNVDVENQDKE